MLGYLPNLTREKIQTMNETISQRQEQAEQWREKAKTALNQAANQVPAEHLGSNTGHTAGDFVSHRTRTCDTVPLAGTVSKFTGIYYRLLYTPVVLVPRHHTTGSTTKKNYIIN
jgi:hypothetical protein